MKKTVKDIVMVISILFLVYMAVCVIQIDLHNMTDHVYSWWNILA